MAMVILACWYMKDIYVDVKTFMKRRRMGIINVIGRCGYQLLLQRSAIKVSTSPDSHYRTGSER